MDTSRPKHKAHEVWDTNFDYYEAARMRESGEEGLAIKFGKLALKRLNIGFAAVAGKVAKVAFNLNEKRKAEKAERKERGSLDIVHDNMRTENDPHRPPRPVTETGLYASNFSGRDTDAELLERDSIMEEAVARAKRRIDKDALPTITMHRDTTPQSMPPHVRPQTLADLEVVERLEEDWNQEPVEPDRSGHAHPTPKGEDHLAGAGGSK